MFGVVIIIKVYLLFMRIKTHMVLSADGKNSNLRKLLSIKTMKKKVNHIAVSGFLQQSKNHNSTAIQAFTNLGPIGLLPFQDKNIINFVQSIDENRLKGEDIIYVNNAEVTNIIKKYKPNVIIHGHTHRPNIHWHDEVIRYVLGDWYNSFFILSFDKDKFFINKGLLK